VSTALATVLVLRSLYDLGGKPPAYEVFAPLTSPGEVTFTGRILSWPFAPLQSVISPALPLAGLTPPPAPPLRFSPLRRFPSARQPLTPEATDLRVRALAAFLTLSGPYSAQHLPALFHAGPTLGV
jgi:hypothetical protein